MNTTDRNAPVKTLREIIHAEIVPALEQLADELPDDLNHWTDAEQTIRKRLHELAGRLLQGWADSADRGGGVPSCPDCKGTMRHRGLKAISIQTMIGLVNTRRPRYRCTVCGREFYPHDAAIRFLSHGVSVPLARVIARMGADGAFERAAENLAEDYQVHVGKQLVEQVTEDAGRKILEAEDAKRDGVRGRTPSERPAALPKSHDPPCRIAVACCDGAMIHTNSTPAYLQGRNEDKADWREIRVANISVGDPLPKEPADANPKRGHHFKMNVRRSRTFARFESVEDVGWDMYTRAVASGFFDAPLQCFVSDGAGWLRNMADEFFPKAVQILDWFHAMEHIGELAAELFGSGSKKAKEWTEQRETELWNGEVGKVLHAIRRLREIRRQRDGKKWSEKQHEKIDKTITYLANNRDRMDYPRYRRLGLPIGSGRIEGLCKTLVTDRCKQSGMRGWTPTGAEGVLRLRAARHDRAFNTTWWLHFAA